MAVAVARRRVSVSVLCRTLNSRTLCVGAALGWYSLRALRIYNLQFTIYKPSTSLISLNHLSERQMNTDKRIYSLLITLNQRSDDLDHAGKTIGKKMTDRSH